MLYPLSYGRNFTARASVSCLGRIGAVADTDVFTARVPDGDFIVLELPPKWVVRRTVGDGASQTSWAFSGGEAPAVAQALIFARHDKTAAWLRVDSQRYRLIESFRP